MDRNSLILSSKTRQIMLHLAELGRAWPSPPLPPLPSALLPATPNWRLGAAFDLEQDETPLIDALIDAANAVRAPFFFPGHKMGAGAPKRLRMRRFGLGSALRHDLPELPELDNLFAPEGPILHAQELAARAFAAQRTWFLANGSTAGVLAAVLACVQLWREEHGTAAGPRPVLLVPRNAHKSVYHALVLTGAQPRWLAPEFDAPSGLCVGITPATIGRALAESGGAARVAAVLLVSPTYEGVLSDIGAAAELCRAVGVPLVVDEAHGAHLGFVPATAATAVEGWPRAPRPALAEGADIAIQSTHKTLGSLTQSAMLHLGQRAAAAEGAAEGEAEGRRRMEGAICAALEIVQSSSPSYLLLASLDAARWQVASPYADGRARLLTAARHAADVRAAVNVKSYRGPRLVELRCGAGAHAIDPLRLTLRASGFALDDSLIAQGVYAELPQAHSLTLALSAGTTRAHVRRLLRALARHGDGGARDAADAIPRDAYAPSTVHTAGAPVHATGDGATARAAAAAASAVGRFVGGGDERTAPAGEGAISPREGAISPREAHFAPRRTVAADDAVGKLSAELICPYPPGVPLLFPGEPITAEILAELRALRDAGCTMTGCSDADLGSLTVLATEGDEGRPGPAPLAGL